MTARVAAVLALLLAAGCGKVGPLSLPDGTPPPPLVDTEASTPENNL